MKFSANFAVRMAFVMTTFLLVATGSTHPQAPFVSQESGILKVPVDLVSLNVTVTDKKGRNIPGLERKDFRVLEDNIEQDVTFFSSEQTPVSWGLILDRSGSMEEMIKPVYRAAVHVMDEGSEADEIFAVTFSERPNLVSDFTADRHALVKALSNLNADGSTALYDAIAFGLDHISNGTHDKKVLVVITDGEDNVSRLRFDQLIKLVKDKQDVLLYAVGMFEPAPWWMSGNRGGFKRQLEELSKVTGATAHFPRNVEECQQVMKVIALEVSQHYNIAYHPRNHTRDGRWRKIQVEPNSWGRQKQQLVVRTRSGYFAPQREP